MLGCVFLNGEQGVFLTVLSFISHRIHHAKPRTTECRPADTKRATSEDRCGHKEPEPSHSPLRPLLSGGMPQGKKYEVRGTNEIRSIVLGTSFESPPDRA